jgi:peptidoglycan/LPS O-acetylase OafA/YrhL
MAASKAQLPALTGVRFFAAAHVVFYHYGQPLFAQAPSSVRAFVGNGFVGVSFFFVLSGFILAYTYADACDRPSWARDFWIARFARVYPMYAAALAATGVLLAITHPHSTARTIALSGVASLLLVQSWVPVWVGVWNIPGWSLSVEALFYAAFPAFFPWLVRRSSGGIARVIALATASALVVPALYVGLDPDGIGRAVAPGGDTTLLDVVKYEPLLHLPQFIVGAAFGCAFARRPAAAQAAQPSAMSALSVPATLAILAALSVPYGRFFPLVHDGLLAPLFGVFIYGLAIGRGPIAGALRAPALVFLGRASYATYVLQHPVWIAVPNALIRLGVRPGLVSFLITFACLMAASVVGLLAIEEPGRRWIRDAFRRSKARSTRQAGAIF